MRDIPSSEITPEPVYLSRRSFMRAVGTLVAGTWVLNACGTESPSSAMLGADTPPAGSTTATTDELSDPLTAYDAVTNYNNFYEFSTDKEAVASLARTFTTTPWSVAVGGLVDKPKTYAFEDIEKRFPSEERVYRLRCVEGWSMVIPWQGFSLSKLLEEVRPQSGANYVAFETLHDPKRMPNQRSSVLDWPYVEGLRMDEALHPLTILATGLYGEPLPSQNGAPVRLVVPWKYGFKSIKSVVRVTLTERMPPTSWSRANSEEYGFFSNVNPEVPHPRWSQATEQRIGEWGRRQTLPFNGYAEQVASLYDGMDLKYYF